MESGSGITSPPSNAPLTAEQIDAHKAAQAALNSRIKVTTKLTSAAASLAAGGKAKDINTAVTVGESAVEHNYLMHIVKGLKAVVKLAKKSKDVVKTLPKDKTSKVLKKPKGTNNPVVAKARKIGIKEHNKFAEKIKNKGNGWKSEKRVFDKSQKKYYKIDAVTPSGRPVELKPRTKTGIMKGKTQLKDYERVTGKKGRVVYYDPK